jgi:hypothetical protein
MGVSGTIFDVIATTTHRWDKKHSPRCMHEPEFFFSLIDQLQNVPCFSPGLVYQPSSEPLWLILARTLTGEISDCNGREFLLGRYPSFSSLNHLGLGSLPWLSAIWDRFSEHCFSPTGEVFQHVLLRNLGGISRPFSTDGQIAFGFLNYLANILILNVLFVTMDGHIGLAPRHIQGGDFVAIVNGCDTPYVVRPAGMVKYEEIELDNAIQVVGPCYLHGIMNGELFTDRSAPRFSRLKWTRHDGDIADSLEGWMLMV